MQYGRQEAVDWHGTSATSGATHADGGCALCGEFVASNLGWFRGQPVSALLIVVVREVHEGTPCPDGYH